MEVADNLAVIRKQIVNSAQSVGRDPEQITLVAVSKYVEIERIQAALAAGVSDLAENRVQEGAKKFPQLKGEFRRHLIGTLQTNKVKLALENFDLIHSLDRLNLAEALAKQADKMERQVEVLIQVNVSGEASKHGCAPDELQGFLEQLLALPQLVPSGLMTMAPLATDPELARPVFRRLRELFEQVTVDPRFATGWRYLSMGMSQDYVIAIEEGANLLRVGTAMFS